ncbi:MAG TPA: IS630 family transposase [Terriglobia bacterium]|nr:IS630 family transposase [Terriglobia bacterium]
MIFVTLTDDEQLKLREFGRHEVGRVALRAQMIQLSGRGYSVPKISAIHECGEDVVRHWLDRYQRLGLEGLRDDLRSGRPPKDPLAEQIIDAQASQSPPCSGHVQSFWTVALLRAFLAIRFVLPLSQSTVRRLLKRAGWRWRRPRLAPAGVLRAKADPHRDERLAAIEQARQEALSGACRVLFLDECDLQLLPVVRAMWMKGDRVRVPTPGINAKRAFFGALDFLSGGWHYMAEARKLAVHFVAFLERILACYPGERLVLVMDNVPTHHARLVTRWLEEHPQVRVLWLPCYAAHEANPVERIWGLLKNAIAANRLCRCIDELVNAADRYFRDMPAHPVAAGAQA